MIRQAVLPLPYTIRVLDVPVSEEYALTRELQLLHIDHFTQPGMVLIGIEHVVMTCRGNSKSALRRLSTITKYTGFIPRRSLKMLCPVRSGQKTGGRLLMTPVTVIKSGPPVFGINSFFASSCSSCILAPIHSTHLSSRARERLYFISSGLSMCPTRSVLVDVYRAHFHPLTAEEVINSDGSEGILTKKGG